MGEPSAGENRAPRWLSERPRRACRRLVSSLGRAFVRWPSRGASGGFSLIEVTVATGASVVLLAGAVMLFRQAIDIAYTVGQRAEMQQNARVAINSIARDVATASTGMPSGGIQLPGGAGAASSKFACRQGGVCYLTSNAYPLGRLYAVNPADGIGPGVNGVTTDAIVVAYRDVSYVLDQLPLVSITATGNQIQVDAATAPPINDPAVGITAGNVLAVCNVNGCAAATVTSIDAPNRLITFSLGDPLNFNQSGAPFGNIAALATPAGSGTYPQARAYRIMIVTYYIDVTTPSSPRLMRQVNAQSAVPVAENIENLQLTYDTFDDNAGVETSNLPNAGGAPNQIRKVNIVVSSRGPIQRLVGRGFDRLTLATSVSPRNLSFKDRYQ